MNYRLNVKSGNSSQVLVVSARAYKIEITNIRFDMAKKGKKAKLDRIVPIRLSSESLSPSQCGKNLKDQVGELLLYLQSTSDELSWQQKKKCWQVFDLTLRKYLDLKHEEQSTESQKSDKKVLE